MRIGASFAAIRGISRKKLEALCLNLRSDPRFHSLLRRLNFPER